MKKIYSRKLAVLNMERLQRMQAVLDMVRVQSLQIYGIHPKVQVLVHSTMKANFLKIKASFHKFTNALKNTTNE